MKPVEQNSAEDLLGPSQTRSLKPVSESGSSVQEARYAAPALEKGLQILEVLTSAESPLSTMEIARAVGRSRNEIYRVLQVLGASDYITREPGGEGYVPTEKLFTLAMGTAPVLSLNEAALPAMRRLSNEIGHSVQLVVPSGNDVVFIARVESEHVFGFAVQLGYHRPAVLSTSGRLLFGFQTFERQVRWLEQMRSDAPEGADFDSFLADAERARRDGWIIRHSVTVEGITDIAAPIWSARNEGCIANLMIPFIRRHDERMTANEVVTATRAAADRITAQLHPVLRPLAAG